jgi:hypothetical protein
MLFSPLSPVNIDDIGKQLIKLKTLKKIFNLLLLDLMKDLDLMHEPETKGDQESLEDEPVSEEPQDSDEQQQETEKILKIKLWNLRQKEKPQKRTEMLEELRHPLIQCLLMKK